MQQITVRVPASTSNLGPGFDCLGVALRIYNTVTMRRRALCEHVHPRIVSEAADLFFKQTHRRAFSFSCSTAEQIPRSRGLGSSATIRLAILVALNRLSGSPLDRLAIFRLCAELEGHPDNAAPATFGGFTVVHGRDPALRRPVGAARRPYRRDDYAAVQRFTVSPRLYFVLFVPDLEVQTSRARNVLPLRISHAAAVENCGKACALTAAFVSYDYQKLHNAFADHLHQPFRAKLIPFRPPKRPARSGRFSAEADRRLRPLRFIHPKELRRLWHARRKLGGTPSSRTLITSAPRFLPVTNHFSPITILHGPPA